MLAGLPQGTARGTNYCGPVTIPFRVREHVLHSLRAVCGFSYVPQELLCDTGPTVYRPYRGRLESLTVCRCYYSLRSKRFQSSYSAKFGAGAKKKWKGEGEGRRGKVPSLPSPSPFIPFFALVPVFSTNSRGTACYAG